MCVCVSVFLSLFLPFFREVSQLIKRHKAEKAISSYSPCCRSPLEYSRVRPRELLVTLIKHGGGISCARASRGTAGRFGSQRARLPRDDTRDEEDVGTDLDFSKYTHETGTESIMRAAVIRGDLWAAIYRAAHRSARHESTRITERSCQSRGSPEERASVEEEARTCANPAALDERH